MQIITIGSTPAALQAKLAEISDGFFDAVEINQSNSKIVDCKIDGTVVLSIKIDGAVSVSVAGGTFVEVQRDSIYTTDWFKTIVYTEKTIVLLDNLASVPLVIFKGSDNDVYFADCKPSSYISNPYSGASAPVTIYKSDGTSFVRTYTFNTETSNRNLYSVPLYVNGVVKADNLFVSLVRPYVSDPGHMAFTMGGLNFVSFAGTTFVVKG